MKTSLKITDKIVLFPFWIITLFPLRILYLLADFIYFILYYIAGYRKKVVLTNLTNSFPEKSNSEIKKIARKFYRYLCDYFIESIYLINMSVSECNRRYKFTNPQLVLKYYNSKQNIILACSHYGNWEWMANVHEFVRFHNYGIYKPLSNKTFDRLFIYIRSKYGGTPVTMKHTLKVVLESMRNKQLFDIYLVGDQRPSPEDTNYWTTFLNQETPIITGMDRLARKFNLPVIFAEVERERRGYYSVTFRLITDNPQSEPENNIVEKYIRAVEKLIQKKPEFWLWSHNRWKYKPEKYKPKAAI